MIVYRVASDAVLDGKRTVRVVKLDRDERRHSADVLLGEAVFWNEPYTIERAKRMINSG